MIVSLFYDYAYRGPLLMDYCLYDYCSLIYKRKADGGIKFIGDHPQHKSHNQFVRENSVAIPWQATFRQKRRYRMSKNERITIACCHPFLSPGHIAILFERLKSPGEKMNNLRSPSTPQMERKPHHISYRKLLLDE
jgi:hypothetical protein